METPVWRDMKQSETLVETLQTQDFETMFLFRAIPLLSPDQILEVQCNYNSGSGSESGSNAQCRICAASLTKPTSMDCSISAAYATGDRGHEHGCATPPIAPSRLHPPAPTASVHDNDGSPKDHDYTLDDEQATKICQIICRKHEIYRDLSVELQQCSKPAVCINDEEL